MIDNSLFATTATKFLKMKSFCKPILALFLGVFLNSAFPQIDLQNLRYSREFQLANFEVARLNSKPLKYKFILRNDQDNRNSLTSLGRGWCPILRDEGPSLMPLQQVYEIHDSKNFELMWGECSGAFKAKVIFSLVSASNPNKKSIEEIYAGKFDEKEEFIFSEKNAIGNSNRATLKISKKNGIVIWYPAYQAYFIFDSNNRIKSIASTEARYDIERAADGKTTRITYADSSRNQAKELVEKKHELIAFSYLENDLLDKLIFGSDQSKSVVFEYGDSKIITRVKNIWNNYFEYKYDQNMMLTEVSWPGNTKETIFYNAATNAASGYIDRAGCLHTYKYVFGLKKTDYKTYETKTCKGEKIHEREFVMSVADTGEERSFIRITDAKGERIETQ